MGAREESTAPGSPAAAPSRWARPLGAIRQWLADPDREVHLVVAALLAALFTVLLVWKADGGLLFVSDFHGLYYPGGLAVDPSTDQLLLALSAALIPGDIYAAQSLWILLTTFLVLYWVQRFTYDLFRPAVVPAAALLASMLAAPLYLVNPYTITWGVVTIMANVTLSAGLFFLVMRQLLRLGRSLWACRSYPYRDAVILGISVGLYAFFPSFPNVIRALLIIVGGTALIFLAAAVLVRHAPGRKWRAYSASLLRVVLISAPVSLVILSDALYSFLTSNLANAAAISTVQKAYAPRLTHTSYNTLGFVSRLLSRIEFNNYSYASSFSTDPWVLLASYSWVLAGLLIPIAFLIVARVPRARSLFAVLGIMVVSLIWSTGLNPPFGAINGVILNPFPLVGTVIPPFYLELDFLVRLYPCFAGFVVAVLIFRTRWRPRPWSAWLAETLWGPSASRVALAPSRGGPARVRLVTVIPAVVLIGLLMAAPYPLYNGTALGLPGEPNYGYHVPGEYSLVHSEYLHGSGDTTLLLPGLTSYINTTWGYNGGTLLYDEIFYPTPVITPSYFGHYGIYVNSSAAAYANLTQPLLPSPILTNLDAQIGGPTFPHPTNGSTYTTYLFNVTPTKGLDLSPYQWVTVNVTSTNEALLVQALAAGTMTFGLRTSSGIGNLPGLYSVAPAYNSIVTPTSNGFSISMLVGQPDGKATYNSSMVNFLLLRFPGLDAKANITFAITGVAGSRSSTLVPGWVTLAQQFGVRYILVDRSVLAGTVSHPAYGELVLTDLASFGLSKPVYNGTDLTLATLDPGE
ncbi:MAG: hypothetical protein WBE40_07760 [Thermoplasmata archaeon]